jgi:uncharacterized protein YegL
VNRGGRFFSDLENRSDILVSYASFSQSFNSFIVYATPKLQRAWVWCQTQARKGNAHRIIFSQCVKKEASTLWNQGRTSLIQNQVALKKGGGALAMVFLAWKLYKYRQSLPEHPKFALASSLNYARVIIGMPEKEKEAARHIRLVFCIDTSGSMIGSSEKEVKEGMKAVLRDGANRVNEELVIEVAVVGFNDRAHEIAAPKILNQESVESLINKVESYQSKGTTSIIAGVEKACEGFGKMKQGAETSSVLILLTDGQDGQMTSEKGKELADRVAALGARLFAIGIKGFNQEILKRLIAEKNIIDTTKGTSIVGAISILYKRAIAKFCALRLYCPELSQAGQWSLKPLFDGEQELIACKEQGIDLATLAEGETREYQLCIDILKLDAPIDLKQLVFKLAFKDPRGIKGEVTLPWRGKTVADTAIITPKKKGECFPHFMKQGSVS